ncbi:hypothetical protein ISS30_01660 [bacterium]|nr:hypothetical protein [bacterium]
METGKRNGRLPCGIPQEEHPVCYERRCYLSGEGCPVHIGPKKRIFQHLPEYLRNTIEVNGVRIKIKNSGEMIPV